jgi:hypothetical protein
MLYLHIGTNKAGSTTIRRFLHSKPAAAAGLRAVTSTGVPNAWKLSALRRTRQAHRFFVKSGFMTEADYRDLPDTLWTEIAQEVAADPDADHVMSSEFIYSYYRRDKAAIAALADRLLDLFGEVRVLFYCRDQLTYLRSCHAQGVKGNRRQTEPLETYLDRARRKVSDWDYHGTLTVWEQIFGRDALRVRVMEPAFLEGGDLITDILAATDRNAAQIATALEGRRRAFNVSPPDARIEGIRRANRLLLGPPPLRALHPTALRAVKRAPLWLLSPLLPQQDPAPRYAPVFYGTNAAFNARFVADQPDALPLPPAGVHGPE